MKRTRVNAIITRNENVVRTCVYADTVARFCFTAWGNDYLIRYWINGVSHETSRNGFLSAYIEGRFSPEWQVSA